MATHHQIVPTRVSSSPMSCPAPNQDPQRIGRRGAYSTAKLLNMKRYIETTSPWRVTWVLVTTPMYGLIGSLLPALVPLQDPLAGAAANPGYHAMSFLICCNLFLGMMTHWRAGASLPARVYSRWQALTVALVAALAQQFAVSLAVFVWRFPLPMSWIVLSTTTTANVALAHLVVFGSRLWTDQELKEGIQRYIPALLFQALQLFIYPAFSVLFDRVSSLYQVLLTLLFPVVKYIMKRGLRRHTKNLDEFNTEVGVSGIEICASLYQSMIMQNAPSKAAMAIIMGVDILQGLVTVKIFMDQKSDVPQKYLVCQAFKEIESQRSIRADEKQQPHVGPTDSASATSDSTSLPLALPFVQDQDEHPVTSKPKKTPTAVAPIPSPALKSQTTSLVEETSRQPLPTVRQALELVNIAESILLVEYLEVVIPLVNALFVAISCQFPSAQYNMKLRNLYFHPEALSRSVLSIALYSLLQALSFVAMHLVMKHRYGLSATYHLAFILEHHWESIVGKMLGWLPIILYFNVIHFGVDFSFRFDFAAMLNDGNG